MKARWISIPIIALMIIGAGLILTTEVPVTEALVTQVPAARLPAADELVKKSGCLECHSVDKKVIGPAFRDIAARYKDNARARDALIEKVKKGGKGNWTDVTSGVPMPPHSPRISDADIKRLVDWVLGL